ncbi:MAG: hypothetical protein ACF8MF_06695 [Phycisphaerales bacterium JB052]
MKVGDKVKSRWVINGETSTVTWVSDNGFFFKDELGEVWPTCDFVVVE